MVYHRIVAILLALKGKGHSGHFSLFSSLLQSFPLLSVCVPLSLETNLSSLLLCFLQYHFITQTSNLETSIKSSIDNCILDIQKPWTNHQDTSQTASSTMVPRERVSKADNTSDLVPPPSSSPAPPKMRPQSASTESSLHTSLPALHSQTWAWSMNGESCVVSITLIPLRYLSRFFLVAKTLARSMRPTSSLLLDHLSWPTVDSMGWQRRSRLVFGVARLLEIFLMRFLRRIWTSFSCFMDEVCCPSKQTKNPNCDDPRHEICPQWCFNCSFECWLTPKLLPTGNRYWLYGILQVATRTFHAQDENVTGMTYLCQGWDKEFPIRPGDFQTPQRGIWLDNSAWCDWNELRNLKRSNDEALYDRNEFMWEHQLGAGK